MRRTSWLLVARAWVPAKGTADTVAFPAQAASADAEARQAELFEQIGRLKMELEWVKKKAAVFM